MMDKDFVKLNEEELKDVVGGASLNYYDLKEFENLNTAKEASDFLFQQGKSLIIPSKLCISISLMVAGTIVRCSIPPPW